MGAASINVLTRGFFVTSPMFWANGCIYLCGSLLASLVRR